MSAIPQAPTLAPSPSQGFIASRSYDWLFFVFSPLLALAIAEGVRMSSYAFERTRAFGTTDTRIGLFIAVFTAAHLAAVFFRSHLNPVIRQRYWFRLTWIPLGLYLFLALAPEWIFLSAFVVAFFWDVYHSAMQNFGLCRIYDAKLGNDSTTGRRLDYWLNHVLYIGPIFIGLNLMAHLEKFLDFQKVGFEQAATWIYSVEKASGTLAWIAIAAGLLFCAYYILAYRRLCKQGYRISPHKIALLGSVGITCVWAWGFMSPLEAFFIVNLFHAAQYFAIVWWMERKSMSKVLRVQGKPWGRPLVLMLFLGLLVVAGITSQMAVYSQIRWFGSAALSCALLHFWYDGFIWSVRRKEV